MEQQTIHEKAMEWVNDSVMSWIRNGDDLEEIINRGWLYYSITFYVRKNKSKVLEKFSNNED